MSFTLLKRPQLLRLSI